MPQQAANLRAQRIAVVGLLVNIALAAIKLIACLLGHSYALVADAVESMTDILGSVVIWSGLRIGSLPPMKTTPGATARPNPSPRSSSPRWLSPRASASASNRSTRSSRPTTLPLPSR